MKCQEGGKRLICVQLPITPPDTSWLIDSRCSVFALVSFTPVLSPSALFPRCAHTISICTLARPSHSITCASSHMSAQ
ncbi:hypothetical protein E2C01_089098 [Portunus trituberculatus]|uniref:Uncharacterized protein n=1 Tax=Portunus trituberculatus TaxID=210409 RepID=A0A5B7JB26_PORTR|nr:hypothetical protein [Portunus trituberculatus]